MLKLLNTDSYDPSEPDQLLGLDWNNRSQTELRAKYFIGLKWIKEGESAVYVRPKIENIDFMSMFMHCFGNDCRDVAMKLGNIYCIDFDKKPIEVNAECIELTPILIAHFLKLTKGIVQQGLKSNYICREENLNSKIKGKILINRSVKRNLGSGRMDRTACRYQDYSIDCPENGILKKTLLFVERYVSLNPNISCSQDLRQISAYCMGAMASVRADIPRQQIKQFKVNPLYRDYAAAIKIAKIILRRFSYNLESVKKDMDRTLPPFWIDMSLLFELYVYSQLKKTYGHQIKHHVRTHGNEIDFVKYDEELIIDAKYIPQWENTVSHDNIRQLSGYARSVSLRKKLLRRDRDDTTIIDCLIIYPSENGCLHFSNSDSLLNDNTSIDSYLKFHKLAIQLPTKKAIPQ